MWHILLFILINYCLYLFYVFKIFRKKFKLTLLPDLYCADLILIFY